MQVESLQRIDLEQEPHDIIVIDKSISMLKQFSCKDCSALTQLQIQSFQILCELLCRVKFTFIMDAYTDISTIAAFQMLNDLPVQIYINSYPKMENLVATIYGSIKAGIYQLCQVLGSMSRTE